MVKIDYEKLGKSVGSIVAEKQKAYGDSFSKSHKILKVLYPDGIDPSQYMDVLTICRVVDKLFRLATDPTYGDESPWRDICGYSLLSMGKDSRENERTGVERMDETPSPTRKYWELKPDTDNSL
tara:strand:- start:49 stop:420 length:372 start_codon:yes stop_codon:yes gene_type:complete